MTAAIQDIHIITIVSLLKGKLLSMASCPDSSRADYILHYLHFLFSTAVLTSYLDGRVGLFHTLKQLLPSVLKVDHQQWEEQSLCLLPLSQDYRFDFLADCKMYSQPCRNGALVDCNANVELHWYIANKSVSKIGWEQAVNCMTKFFLFNSY